MTLVFAHLPLENREDLAKLVAEHCRALEEDLRLIARRLDGSKWGPMDLLAVDAHHRLVIIDVSPREGNQLLLEGLAHLGWLHRNHSQLTRLVGEQEFNLTLPPRLILVARGFPEGLQEVIDGLASLAIDLYRFRWLEAGDQKGLLLEPVFVSSERKKSDQGVEAPLLPPAEGSVRLAEEEIAAFMELSPRCTL